MSEYTFGEAVASQEELRSLLGTPGELVKNKAVPTIDPHCRRFISMSPMLFMATSDLSGRCDVSPRGDSPGFVLVLDDGRLVIPERPGNRRLDSLCNILEYPRVGLVFVIPGLGETLRVNGKAQVIKDRPVMERLESHGKLPLVGICVEVEECFIHCAKAFKRSHLWEPSSWPGKDALPSASAILADHSKESRLTEDQISTALRESYERRLY